MPPIGIQLKSRFAKFKNSIHKCVNKIVYHVSLHAMRNPLSVYRRNCLDNGFNDNSNLYNEWYRSVNICDIDKANVIREMINVREGLANCDIFNIDDVNFIIESLCID